MADISITYHNPSGKRNQIVIDLEQFFPCDNRWTGYLIKTVIERSDDPARYRAEIQDYLYLRLDWIRQDLARQVDEDGNLLPYVSQADHKKLKSDEKKIRAALDLIAGGGADGHGQHSDSTAG